MKAGGKQETKKFQGHFSGKVAGRPGFEPRLLGPEPRVLPLNYLPTSGIVAKTKKAVEFVDNRLSYSIPACEDAP